MIAAWGVQTSWNRPPQGPVATHQGAWHQRIDDNPLTAQIPGLSHRKIRLGPTFHTVSLLCANSPEYLVVASFRVLSRTPQMEEGFMKPSICLFRDVRVENETSQT